MHVFNNRAGRRVSEVFVRTDPRRASSPCVIGSAMGAFPRGAGSNPVESAFFFAHSVSSIFRFSMTPVPPPAHTHTQ